MPNSKINIHQIRIFPCGLARIDTFPGQLTTALLGIVNSKKKKYLFYFFDSIFYLFGTICSRMGLAGVVAIAAVRTGSPLGDKIRWRNQKIFILSRYKPEFSQHLLRFCGLGDCDPCQFQGSPIVKLVSVIKWTFFSVRQTGTKVFKKIFLC